MAYTPVYDFMSDGRVGLYFPALGLAILAVGLVAKFAFGKGGLFIYFPIVVGIFTLLVSGAVPLWDNLRVKKAIRHGDAVLVEGPVQDWRIVRSRGIRNNNRGKYSYVYWERFLVGGVAFNVEWNSLEAGFNNAGSEDGEPKIRLADAKAVRLWYLPIRGPEKAPKIVRLEIAP